MIGFEIGATVCELFGFEVLAESHLHNAVKAWSNSNCKMLVGRRRSTLLWAGQIKMKLTRTVEKLCAKTEWSSLIGWHLGQGLSELVK